MFLKGGTIKNKIAGFLFGMMTLISCGSCVVVITDLPPDLIQLDPFDLQDIEIVGDTITLNITYSGGCEEHCFSLYMSPATFFESYPVQADLFLRHDSNGDACDALINKNVSFNLRPIAELHKSFYGQYDEIILNVFEYFKEEPNEKMSTSYFPE